MNSPSLEFVDDSGSPLPFEDFAVQRVRQFRGRWRVRVLGDWDGIVAIEALDAGLPLSLIRHGSSDWCLPQKTSLRTLPISESVRQRYEDTISAAGEVTVILLDRNGHVAADGPRATLLISPGNFSDEQMQQMVKDIGLLALSTASCVTASWQAPLGEGAGSEMHGFEWYPGRGLLVTATAILRLAQTVQRYWPTVIKRPIRSITTGLALTNTHRAGLSPDALLKARLNPARRAILARTLVETVRCPENLFIAFVVQRYLRELAEGLAARVRELDVEDADFSHEFAHPKEMHNFLCVVAPRRSEVFNVERARLRTFIERTASCLDDCAEWASRAQTTSFLKDLEAPDEAPEPTLRLTGSPGYGPIYRDFTQSRGGSMSRVAKVLPLFQSTQRGHIRPVWEIYELWCAAKLYDALVSNIKGLKPPHFAPTLFEGIRVVNSELHIPTDRPFPLETELGNLGKLRIALQYNPELRNTRGELRTPDIFLRVKLGDREEEHFVFDAKYRNYTIRRGAQAFVEDVYGVAREKYLHGLAKDATGNELNVVAAFILHSDEHSKFDYWGEVPLYQAIEDSFGTEAARQSYFYPITSRQSVSVVLRADDFASHCYGAISLKPHSQIDVDHQLRKIILSLLQYHYQNGLQEVCIGCGKKAERMDDRFSRTAGSFYSCPECGRFWVTNHCYSNGHYLLKLGRDSFHRRSDEQSSKWLFRCPECGDPGESR